MSASSKTLSYSSYEPILLHMSADQRIRFAIHCPGIRTVDKLIPLKIKSLILNPLELQLDGAIYEIDFVRRNHLSKTTQLMSNRVDRIHFSQEIQHSENGAIEITRKIEEFLLGMVTEGEMNVLHNENQDSPPQPKATEELQLPISDLLEARTELDMIRPLDHTDYLRLSESSGKVESLEYIRSACSTMHYLLKKFFGNREVIYVNHMGVEVPELPKEKKERKIDGLTVPSMLEYLEEFNFRVSQLSLQSKDLKMEKPSFFELLERVNFNVNLLLSQSKHLTMESPMLQNIQKLTISGNMSHTDMQKLQVNNVHFLDNIRPFSQLTVSYHNGSKPMEIGFCWTFDMRGPDHATVGDFFFAYSMPGVVLIDRVSVRENLETRGTCYPRKIVYQAKDNTSELHAYCKRSEGKKWMIVLEVLPVGN